MFAFIMRGMHRSSTSTVRELFLPRSTVNVPIVPLRIDAESVTNVTS